MLEMKVIFIVNLSHQNHQTLRLGATHLPPAHLEAAVAGFNFQSLLSFDTLEKVAIPAVIGEPCQ